jgi:hypothetical protein
MKTENALNKILKAIKDIKGVTVEGAIPLFEVKKIDIKGTTIIGAIERSTGDMFAIRVQKLEGGSRD